MRRRPRLRGPRSLLSLTGATGVPACSHTGATKRAKETGQRVRLCAKTTKETPLLPMVRLRPGVLSRPTWFAEVRRDDLNAPNCQYGLAVNKKHAQSPKARQAGPLRCHLSTGVATTRSGGRLLSEPFARVDREPADSRAPGRRRAARSACSSVHVDGSANRCGAGLRRKETDPARCW